MEPSWDNFESAQSNWMDRLLIAVDESLKLGVSAEELSSVGSELAPGDLQRFEEARHCIELLDRVFRQPSQPQPDSSQRDVALDLAIDSSASAQPFPSQARYQMLQLLGAGAMGIVYKVIDQERKTTVAFKKLRENNPARILRFKQEFRRLANVSHANVVALFELAQADNDWFITMELVDGVDFLSALSLRQIPAQLSSSGGASLQALAQICELFIQLANGLEALHAAGILHRDLKPSNVLVTPGHRVVVIDFGLATSFDWLRLQGTQLQEFAGTFAYMAPEQVACQSLTPASDWYSFGVMLYQAFTGALPVTGPLSLVTKQYRQPPDLTQHLPELPSGWNALCQSLLAPEPTDRPTGQQITISLRELQRALQKNNADEAVHLRPAPGSPMEVRAFIGRQHELEQLRAAYRAASNGQPTVLSIQGSSGIGKTTLVESFLNEITAPFVAENARASTPVILRGRCHERESLPFKTLDSLVDSLCRYLGNCTEDELHDLLPQDMPLLFRIFPVLGAFAACSSETPTAIAADTDPVLLRRRAFEAFRALLLAIAQRSCLIVFIDDLQWGDAPGANVLADLLDTASGAQMLMILAYREEQTSGNECLNSLQLHRLDAWESAADLHPDARIAKRFTQRKISLGPLSPLDAAWLAESLLGANDLPLGELKPPDVQWPARSIRKSRALPDLIAHESGGMPFYVQELVRHAIGAKLSEQSTSWQTDSETLSLGNVLKDRIQSLSDSARQLVSMIAVAGQPVSIDLVCHAIGMPAVDERQLHELRINRWLRSDRDTLQNTVTIFHDRIRESIVASLPQEHRQHLHSHLAHSLEHSNASAETLAYHFEAGNDPARAGHYLKLAGSHALKVFAFEKAIEHYRRAVELSSHEDHGQLMQSLGEAYSQAGRGGEAAAAYLKAAESAPPAEALELRLAAARQYCISGYTDEGRLLVRSVLASNGMYFPKQFLGLVLSLIYQRIRLSLQGLNTSLSAEDQVPREKLQRIDMMWSAVSGLSFQEPVAVAALHSYGLRAALAVGEPKRLTRAVALEAILTATSGPKTDKRVQKLLHMTGQLASSIHDTDTQGMWQLAQGGTAFLQVRMPDAISPLIEAERLFSSRVPKAWWELTTARSLLAWAYMHMGDFHALKQCTDLYQQDAQARGDRFLLSSISSAGIPQLQLAANKPELAQAGLNLLEESIPYEQFQQRHTSMLYSQAQLDLYRDNGLNSWQRIHDNWKLFRKSMQVHNQFARVSMIDLRARCALLEFNHSGDRRLLRSASEDSKLLQREVGSWVQAYIYRLQSLLHAAQSQHEESLVKLRQASEAFEQIGFLSCAAAARRRLGNLMNDAAGLQLVDQAEQFLSAQAIIDLNAFQRVLC